jgi:hypothetical protein
VRGRRSLTYLAHGAAVDWVRVATRASLTVELCHERVRLGRPLSSRLPLPAPACCVRGAGAGSRRRSRVGRLAGASSGQTPSTRAAAPTFVGTRPLRFVRKG